MALPRRPHISLLALLTALLCALGATAAAARAQVNWVVYGHGFGHGVGMSAYGAYGYALHGKGYKFILGHYYPGTALGQISGPNIVRVLLGVTPGDVTFTEATSACRTKLEPTRTYEAHRLGNTIMLRSSAGKPLAKCGATLRAAGAGVINIVGVGRYRGALETVVNESGELNIVNALSIDNYVKGVIPNESPPSWPMAELKAQAVASRSFALTAGREGDGFDLYSDTRSQVYKGLESEYTTSNEAEEQTAGQVLMYEGRIAETLFSACSGGKTESIQNVFGTAIPYLVGVPDPYDSLCPLHEWTLKMTGPEISEKLSGLLEGRLMKVVITKTGYSPRIIEAKLYGTGGVTTVTGEQLEVALGGYSTWMTFEKVVSK
ncbi:MAG TPA: SpoIID/LytB domain-containing protein [Solirubrobacterales bacterium]|nr:SpoIID/LytB domain-containing protein [Solirubrobacterales bacterium]